MSQKKKNLGANIDRRQFLQSLAAAATGSALLPGCSPFSAQNGRRIAASTNTTAQFPHASERGSINLSSQPNVIFISIDDLNDWISPLGGYPGILTPNLSRLASHSLSFANAYCAAPHCGSSRSATLSGIAPFNSQMMRQENILSFEDEVQQRLNLNRLMTIPRFFKEQGYKVFGGGKLYHGGFGMNPGQWGPYDQQAWDDYFHFIWNSTSPNYRIKNNDHTLNGMIGDAYNSAVAESQMPDRRLAQWAVDRLEGGQQSNQPMFLGVGFYRPHISWFVPQRYYDLYPLSSIKVPQLYEQVSDLDDLPPFAVNYLSNIDAFGYGQKLPDGSSKTDHYSLADMKPKDGYSGHAQAIQAYLASTTFIDSCVGQVLDAIEEGGYLQNSVVVLWSDHGWLLGEKLGWRKHRVWEQASRVPMMISVPGAAKGVSCEKVVSTLDIFPTLMDLATQGSQVGVPKQTDGQSLRALLESSQAQWNYGAITSHMVPEANNASVYSLRTGSYRYTAYPTDSGVLTEELYDLQQDRREKYNLLYHEPKKYWAIRNVLRSALERQVGTI